MGLILSLAKTTITYVYNGTQKTIPFTTSNETESSLMTEEEYGVYMKAREDHIRRWSRMYSDSFLEQDYRWDPDFQ